MEWSVGLEIPYRGRVTARKAEALLEALDGHSAAVGGSPVGDSYGARIYVEDQTIGGAIKKAERIFRAALESSKFADPAVELVDVHAQEWTHFERELDVPNFPKLAGVSEVAAMLGVSRQRLYELRERPDFPEPFVELAAGPIWTKAAIAVFLKRWSRKPGRPRMDRAVGG